eukprot:g24980.t1
MTACASRWQIVLCLLNSCIWQVRKNIVSYNIALSSCEKSSSWEMALCILESIPTLASPNEISYAAAITACGKGQQWRLALDMFESIANPDCICYNAAISACAKNEGHFWRLTLELLRSILKAAEEAEAQGKKKTKKSKVDDNQEDFETALTEENGEDKNAKKKKKTAEEAEVPTKKDKHAKTKAEEAPKKKKEEEEETAKKGGEDKNAKKKKAEEAKKKKKGKHDDEEEAEETGKGGEDKSAKKKNAEEAKKKRKDSDDEVEEVPKKKKKVEDGSKDSKGTKGKMDKNSKNVYDTLADFEYDSLPPELQRWMKSLSIDAGQTRLYDWECVKFVHLAETCLNILPVREKMSETDAVALYGEKLRSGDLGARRIADCKFVLANGVPAATKLLRRVLLSGDATMLPKLADWVHSKGLGQDLSKGGLNEFSSVEQSLQKAHDAVLRKAQEAHQKAQQDLVERAAAKKREEEACLKALAESDRKAAAELAARQAEEAAALAQSRRQEQERHAAALTEARVAAELDAFLQLDGSLGTASKDICRMWCVGFRGTRRGPKFLAMSHKLQLKKLASNLAHITRSDVLIISLGHDPTALQETKRELCEAAPALEKFIWQSFPTAVVQNHAGGQYAEFIALARGPSVVAFNLPQVLSGEGRDSQLSCPQDPKKVSSSSAKFLRKTWANNVAPCFVTELLGCLPPELELSSLVVPAPVVFCTGFLGGVKKYNDDTSMLRSLPLTLALCVPKAKAEKHNFALALASFHSMLLAKAELDLPAKGPVPKAVPKRVLKREPSAAEEGKPEVDGAPLIQVPDIVGKVAEEARADSEEEDELHRCDSLDRKIMSRRNFLMSRMGSMERQEILGDNPRHLDLDELQDKHDAKARSLANSNTASKGFAETHSTALDFYSPMPCTARVFLHLMGILSPQTWPFVLLRIWIFSLLVGVGALIGLIIWQSSGKEFYEPWRRSLVHGACFDTITTITTTCYLLGVMSGAWSLRRVKIQELLGSNIGSLELYAHQHGFLAEWHFMSSKRLLETSGFLMLMLATRWLEPFERTCGFCFAAVGMAALAYLQLHLVAGETEELGLVTFTVNFFRNMDLGIASAEWNVVQVTLRQVSTKLGASLLLLGSSCLVSLLLLVEIAFFRPEEQRGELTNVQLILFIAWLVPPLLLFLYVLMRAANITEKAMRVAPLVNSWSFKRGEGSSGWMDVGRQYMVQYIRQSEAGFYFQGRRLYIFQITKLCYYLGAFSMAVLSSIS